MLNLELTGVMACLHWIGDISNAFTCGLLISGDTRMEGLNREKLVELHAVVAELLSFEVSAS